MAYRTEPAKPTKLKALKARAMDPSWSLRIPPARPPTPLPKPKCAPPARPVRVARVPSGALF